MGKRITNLEAARRAKGWSQADVAKAANVAPSTVHRYEWGQRNPNYRQVARVAKAVGVPPGQLLNEYWEPQWQL